MQRKSQNVCRDQFPVLRCAVLQTIYIQFMLRQILLG
jgi:hypothetical protein